MEDLQDPISGKPSPGFAVPLRTKLTDETRGLQVANFARTRKPTLNSELVEALGVRYISTQDLPILEGTKEYGPFGLIFEATGASSIVFESMQALDKNGVLVLSSVTGGNRTMEVPADKINLDFVLGNKVMVGAVNAHSRVF